MGPKFTDVIRSTTSAGAVADSPTVQARVGEVQIHVVFVPSRGPRFVESSGPDDENCSATLLVLSEPPLESASHYLFPRRIKDHYNVALTLYGTSDTG